MAQISHSSLPGLRLLCTNQSEEWNRQFIASLNRHRRAQNDRQFHSGSDTVIPTIDEYTSSLDEYSGVYVILDMVELVEGLHIPEHTDESRRFRSTAARTISYVLVNSCPLLGPKFHIIRLGYRLLQHCPILRTEDA